MGGERFIQAEIAHDRCDQRVPLEASAPEEIHGRDRHDLVAVHQLAVFVAQQHAVGIPVVRDADMGLRFLHQFLDLVRVGAAAIAVDIRPVRVVVGDDHIGTEFAQDAGAGLVGGAVRAIQGDAQRFERESARERLLGEFHIAPHGVVDARGLADLRGGRPHILDVPAENQVLDACLDLVVELVAVVPEKFDAIVLIRVVGGGEDNAGVRPQRACDVGHAGGRQRTDQHGIAAERGEPCDHRVFEHVAREPGVLADDDLEPPAVVGGPGFGEHMRRRAAELQCGFRRHRLDVGGAAHAVRAEKFPAVSTHGPVISSLSGIPQPGPSADQAAGASGRRSA